MRQKNKLFVVNYSQGLDYRCLQTYVVAIDLSTAKSKAYFQLKEENMSFCFGVPDIEIGKAKEVIVPGYKINLEKIVK